MPFTIGKLILQTESESQHPTPRHPPYPPSSSPLTANAEKRSPTPLVNSRTRLFRPTIDRPSTRHAKKMQISFRHSTDYAHRIVLDLLSSLQMRAMSARLLKRFSRRPSLLPTAQPPLLLSQTRCDTHLPQHFFPFAQVESNRFSHTNDRRYRPQ